MRYLFLFLLCAAPLQARWIDRKSEGWAWYEDLEKKEEPKERLQEKRSAKELLDAYKKEVEESLALAILEPSQEHVERYIRLQKEWTDRSKLFAVAWKKTLLEHPELDPSASSFPTSHYGRLLQKKIKAGEKTTLIRSLSKEHGLFFFLDGGLPSQAFAKVVKKFSEKYSWEVFAVSVDGSSTGDFAEPLENNGLSERFGASIYPSLYVVDFSTKKASAIAYGLSSLEGIENNLLLLFGEQPEENLYSTKDQQ